MLSWLACQLAPPIPDLRDAVPPELPDPSPHDELRERAREVLAELATVPFGDRADANPYKVLLAMACRELVTREADQHPDTAGRTPNYAGMPFEPLEIPAGDGVRLTGHHSIGAPGCPVLVVVHGLFDSHTSVYVVELAETIRRWGFHVVTLDLRDHGRLRGRPPQASLGRAEGADLFAAARTLSRAEGVSVGILGLSYGGHCAVRAAYEASVAGEAQVLRGGVMAVGAPLDIHEAVLAFDDRSRLPEPPTFWDRRIANGTFRQMVRHLRLRSAEKGHTPAAGSEYESFIRDVVIPADPDGAPLVGAYLGQARCSQPEIMGALQVPTALVHPVDDFIVPVDHTRKALEAAGDNPFVGARELPAGGHVGLAPVDPQGTLALLATFFGRLRDG